MRRLTAEDYAVDAVTGAKMLVASDRLWIESDGARVKFAAAPRIGIAYALKRDQSRKWRFSSSSFAVVPPLPLNEQTLRHR